jgi:iron only hydrogenase large subunit-like protein
MDQNITSLLINNVRVSAPLDYTILKAAQMAGISIPALCKHPDLNIAGNCRICLVEVIGLQYLVPACATKISEDMEVLTCSEKVRTARQDVIELLLSEHKADCAKCISNGNCTLQSLAAEYGVGSYLYADLVQDNPAMTDSSLHAILKDNGKCIRCGSCIRVCNDLQDTGTFCLSGKGKDTIVTTFMNKALSEVFCTECGQCVLRCPTAALSDKPSSDLIWDKISDPSTLSIAMPSLAVSQGIKAFAAGHFHMEGSTLAASLKNMGINHIIDPGFITDLYIMELCTDFLLRLKSASDHSDQNLPYIIPCSHASREYISEKYPSLIQLLSKVKNPGMMFGPLMKAYMSEKLGVLPEKLLPLLITSCMAAKKEAALQNELSGLPFDGHVLNTREIIRMIKQTGMLSEKMAAGSFDQNMNTHSASAFLYPMAGGITESLIRVLFELITSCELNPEMMQIHELRGMKKWMEYTLTFKETNSGWEFLNGKSIRFAVVNGSAHAKTIFTDPDFASKYHCIEFRTCYGACLAGGGQPKPFQLEALKDIASVLYQKADSALPAKAHENSQLEQLYRNLLQHPGSDKAKELLYYK